jgi:hypothetical protein
MKQYSNISGESRIIGYDEGQDYIIIYFENGSEYTYSYDSAGEQNVEEMKKIADGGAGLNSFINQNCRYNYEQSGFQY